jgi:hypothetical protein
MLVLASGLVLNNGLNSKVQILVFEVHEIKIHHSHMKFQVHEVKNSPFSYENFRSMRLDQNSRTWIGSQAHKESCRPEPKGTWNEG